jgi:prophage antirepressor-like protein
VKGYKNYEVIILNNQLQVLTKQFEGNGVEIIIDDNGSPLFELYSTGMALGQVKIAKGKSYPRKDRIDENIKSADILTVVRDGQQYLTESMLYDFMLEVKTDKVKPFRKWITNDVLPTIRKTGGYVANDDLFVETYLPFADDNTKLLFKTTLVTINNQNAIIKKQKKEIDHQGAVITGLIEDISLAEKRQVLNRVVRKGGNKFQERWNELYKQFEMKEHVNVSKRMENYNDKNKPKVKSKIDYIDKVMNKIPELYDIACKIYESDVNELVEEMYVLAN